MSLDRFASVNINQDASFLYSGLFQLSSKYLVTAVIPESSRTSHSDVDDEPELSIRPSTKILQHNILPGAYANDPVMAHMNIGGWRRPMPLPLVEDEEIRCFKFDQSKRLLVLLTWIDQPALDGLMAMSLRVLEFPSCSAHKDTSCPQIDLEVLVTPTEYHEELPPSCLELCGNMVGVLINEREMTKLRVYNWKNGILLSEYASKRGVHCLSFAFLDEETVTLANRELKTIDIIKINQSTPSILSLGLPPSLDGISIDFVSCCSERHEPDCKCQDGPHCEKDPLVVFTLSSLHSSVKTVRFSTHATSLLDVFARFWRTRLIPWVEWGGSALCRGFPSNTLTMYKDFAADGQYYTSFDSDNTWSRDRLRVYSISHTANSPVMGYKKVLELPMREYGEVIVRSDISMVYAFKMKNQEGGRGEQIMTTMHMFKINWDI